MKKYLILFLIIIVMINVFAVTTSAESIVYGDTVLDDIDDVDYDREEYPYLTVVRSTLVGESFYFIASAEKGIYSENYGTNQNMPGLRFNCKNMYYSWKSYLDDPCWQRYTNEPDKDNDRTLYVTEIIWSNYDVYTVNGDLYHSSDKQEEIVETNVIKSGLYVFNETPVLPVEDVYIHFATPALISYKDDLSTTIYECQRMMINTDTLVYNIIQPSTQSITAYTEPPLVNAGWADEQYRQITIVNDIEVSQTVYDWFIANTTPPPEMNPPYQFTDSEILLDGETFATYADDTVDRIDVDNTYCVMYKNGDIYYIASSSVPFRYVESTGYVRTNPIGTFSIWQIENGVIAYNGNTSLCNATEWIAGNNSILNWDNDEEYMTFTTGMVSFRTTPQSTLQQIVGTGMMLETMKEIAALLPCLIALLVGFLATRKALAVLRMILLTV